MNFLEKIVLSLTTIRNVPQYFLDYIGLLNGDQIYETYSGIKYTTRSHSPDLSELIVVISGRHYPLSYISVTPNPIIIDLGAGIGDFALYARNFLKKFNPKIYSLEPDKTNFKYLVKNIQDNNAQDEIKAINKAIFSSDGTAYLDTDEKGNDQYIVTKDIHKNHPCKTVTLTSLLKEINAKFINILKMDIEGTEYELLKHPPTLKLLNNHVQYLFIEYHDHPKLNEQWLIQQLKNFKFVGHGYYSLIFKNKTIDF